MANNDLNLKMIIFNQTGMIAKLKKSCEISEEEKKNQQEELSIKEAKLRGLENVKKKNETLEDQLQFTEKQLDQIRTDRARELHELNNQIKILDSKILRFKTRISELTDELTVMKKENGKLMSQIEVGVGKVTVLQMEVAQRKAEVEKSRNIVEQVQAEKKSLEKDLSTQATFAEGLKKTISEGIERQKSLSSEKTALEKARETLQKANQTYVEKMRIHENEIDSLQQQNEEVMKKLTEKVKKLKKQQDEDLEEYGKGMKELTETVHTLKQEKVSNQHLKDEAEKSVEDLVRVKKELAFVKECLEEEKKMNQSHLEYNGKLQSLVELMKQKRTGMTPTPSETAGKPFTNADEMEELRKEAQQQKDRANWVMGSFRAIKDRKEALEKKVEGILREREQNKVDASKWQSLHETALKNIERMKTALRNEKMSRDISKCTVGGYRKEHIDITTRQDRERDWLQHPECGHWACRKCLWEALEKGRKYPLTCAQCTEDEMKGRKSKKKRGGYRTIYDDEFLKTVMPGFVNNPKIMDAYTRAVVMAAMNTSMHEKLVMCPKCKKTLGCVEVKNTGGSGSQMTCSYCKHSFCVLCSKSWANHTDAFTGIKPCDNVA